MPSRTSGSDFAHPTAADRFRLQLDMSAAPCAAVFVLDVVICVKAGALPAGGFSQGNRTARITQ